MERDGAPGTVGLGIAKTIAHTGAHDIDLSRIDLSRIDLSRIDL